MSPVAKKLLIKPGMSCAVFNAPEGYLDQLRPLPEGATTQAEGTASLDFVQLFAEAAADLERLVPTCLLYTSPSPRDRQKSRMPSSA